MSSRPVLPLAPASSDGVSAGYRGQIGRRSAWAHAVAHNIEFRTGLGIDILTSYPKDIESLTIPV